MDLKAKAEKLLALHSGDRMLVLVNAWDAPSARIVEASGSPAIATSSAGIANVLGYRDGEQISREGMMQAVAAIAHVVDVPVTADAEAGYGPTPQDAAETARQVMAAGAVGMNFEDSTRNASNPLLTIEQQVERIHAIRDVATEKGIPFVLNARTDVFLAAVGAPETRFKEAVRRANAYSEAGADCLFVPGVTDRDTIAKLVREIRGPINVLATAGTPPVAELEQLGVARVSVGSGFVRACYAHAREVARDILSTGSWMKMLDHPISYVEMNEMMRGR